MASLDVSSFGAVLKQHYTDQRIENMAYKNFRFLAMVKKYEQFGGDVLKLPVIHANSQGVSASFTDAQTNKTAVKSKAFLLERNSYYSVASITNEVLEASVGNANAFLEAATTQIDSAIAAASEELSKQLYGSGSGSIGSISSSTTLTGAVIVLNDTESVVNFEVGMVLEASTADGGGSVKATKRTVIAVDRDLGQVTVDSNLNTGTAWAHSDFLFRDGDYDSVLKGLKAWLPATAPGGSDSFFSVNRSSDPTRLAGIRFDGSAMPIEEALISAAVRSGREGARPDVVLMSFSKFADLEKALGSKVQYVDVKVNPEIGFRGIQINGPYGPIKVMPDVHCPSDRAFMLQMDTWCLYSLKKAPRILDADGNKMLRESSSDAVEIRIGYYAQLGCRAPGWNVNIKLS